MDEMNGYGMEPNKSGFGKKKIIIIAAAVIAAVAIFTGIVSAAVSSSPMNMIASALENTVEKMQDGKLAGKTESIISGGSVEISGNLSKLINVYTGMKFDADFSIKLYTDIKKMMFAAVSSFSVEGTELVDLSAYVDDDNIVVDSGALLGQAYGIKLSDFSKNFKSSVFGDDGAYSLGITDDDVEQFLEVKESNEKFERDLGKITERIWKTAAKSIMKNAEVNKAKNTLTFGDKNVKVTDVTIVFDEKALASVMTDILKFVKDDKTIKSFLGEYAEMLSIDEDDIDDFYDNLDDAIDDIDEIEDEDIEIKIIVSISNSSKEIVGLDVEVEDDGHKEVDFTFTCGPTWKAPTEMKLTIKAPVNMTMTYSVEENTNKVYDAGFTVKMNGSKIVDVDIDWDKKEGDLKIKLADPEIIFKGNLKVSGSITTLVMNSVSVEGEKLDLGDITVTLNSKDKVPSMPKYKDILTLTEDDVDDLIDDVEKAVDEIVGKIGRIIGSRFFFGSSGWNL